MSLGEHLIELRKRITVIAVAIVVAAIGGWFLAGPVWAALSEPLLRVAETQGRQATINYTAVTEAFDTQVAIALVLGVVVSSPIWLWQVWAFVVPALHKRDERSMEPSTHRPRVGGFMFEDGAGERWIGRAATARPNGRPQRCDLQVA